MIYQNYSIIIGLISDQVDRPSTGGRAKSKSRRIGIPRFAANVQQWKE